MAHELCVRKPPENQWVLCKNMKSLPGVRRLASHTSLKVPSLSSLESLGHRGIGEIVLTRLSLKTNWLLANLLFRKGKKASGFRLLLLSKVSVFLKGLILKDSRRQIGDRGEGVVGDWVGWGRIFFGGWNKYFSEEKTIPNSFSASSSFSSLSTLLGQRGRVEAVPEGRDIS